MNKFALSLLMPALLIGLSLAQNPAESQSNAPGTQTAPGTPVPPPGQSAPVNAGSSSTPIPPSGQQSPAPQATAPAGQNGAAGIRIPAGIVIPAELAKSLDAKKVKPGDQVVARTVQDMLANGQVVIPRESKIMGHVTAAQPHSKDQASTLAVAFDSIMKKDGTQLPLHASIQAIGKPLQSAAQASENPSINESGGMPGSASGGVGGMNRAGGAGYPAGQPASPPPGDTSTGSPAPSETAALSTGSQGVIGIDGLTLSNGASSDRGSVMSSSNHNVHLDSGTQLILRTQ